MSDSSTVTDGRRQRGITTVAAILERAADIASIEGLEGLSIGRLAKELSLSKSAVFGHFGSKEQLQIATVDAASRRFRHAVIDPALAVAPGLCRVRKLFEAWIDYATAPVFPGGCFFYAAAAEFDRRPGSVHDAIADSLTGWRAFQTDTIEEAKAAGDLPTGTDAQQLAFELDALVRTAHADALLFDDPGMFDRAKTAISKRIDGSITPGT